MAGGRQGDGPREFAGAKIALVRGAELVAYRRDDRPDIPFPGFWDLPGGGRESDETPERCALRETEEEFGLILPPERIVWSRRYPSLHIPDRDACFFAAPVTGAEVAAIRFGNEGQCWRMMVMAEFIARDDAVPYLRTRLADFLQEWPKG